MRNIPVLFLKRVKEVFMLRDKTLRNTINDVFKSHKIGGLENAILDTSIYHFSRHSFCVSVSPLVSSGLWNLTPEAESALFTYLVYGISYCIASDLSWGILIRFGARRGPSGYSSQCLLEWA